MVNLKSGWPNGLTAHCEVGDPQACNSHEDQNTFWNYISIFMFIRSVPA